MTFISCQKYPNLTCFWFFFPWKYIILYTVNCNEDCSVLVFIAHKIAIPKTSSCRRCVIHRAEPWFRSSSSFHSVAITSFSVTVNLSLNHTFPLRFLFSLFLDLMLFVWSNVLMDSFSLVLWSVARLLLTQYSTIQVYASRSLLESYLVRSCVNY